MANISNLRDHFGLKQQQIADFLEVSRSLITRYENATRNLPHEVDRMYNLLLKTMAKIESDNTKTAAKRKPHPESTGRIKHVQNELEYQAKAAGHKAFKMKNKLLAIQKQYVETRNLMELIDKMLKTVSKEKDKGSFLWLQAQQGHIRKRLLKCDEAVQLQMKARIAILEATSGVMSSEL